MSEKNSSTQLAFILLAQLAFWLVNIPISLYPKILLFLTLDFSMLTIVVSEWLRIKIEWEIWWLKLFGRVKKGEKE